MAKTTTKAYRHISKVMTVLRSGKPVSALSIKYNVGLSDTDVEFALATLMEHKIVTATPGGGKYALVSGYAGKLEVLLRSMKVPEKPKAPKPKPKVVAKLTNTEKLMNCLSDGEEWAFADIVETTGAKTGSVAGLLTTLCKKGDIKKVRRAVYRLSTDDEAEEPDPEKPIYKTEYCSHGEIPETCPDCAESEPADNNEKMKAPSIQEQVEENRAQIAEIKKRLEDRLGWKDDSELEGIRLAHDVPFIYIDVMGVEHEAYIEEKDELPMIVYSEAK